MKSWWRSVLTAAYLGSGAPAGYAEEIVPLAGCYTRAYDENWLKAHRRQIIRRVKLLVTRTSVPETPGEAKPILADAMLIMTTGETAYSTIGACYWDKLGLVCNASLSATKAPSCKTGEDGPRDCRISPGDPGSFEIAQKTSGLVVSIRERLELGGPFEQRSFLYLSPDNQQNHSFLLQQASEADCR
jgi:hypothetical protein